MLSEQLVKDTLGSFSWEALRIHFEDIGLTRNDLTDLCGHVRRFTDLICKYPHKKFKQRRAIFFDEIRNYVKKHLGVEAEKELVCEIELIERIEKGYLSILNTLDKCAIGNLPATIRVIKGVRQIMIVNQFLRKTCFFAGYSNTTWFSSTVEP